MINSGESRGLLPGRVKLRLRAGSIQFAVFAIAFMSIFYAVPVFRLYRIFYFAYFACLWVTALLLVEGKLRLGKVFRDGLPLWVFWAYLPISALWAQYPRTTIYSAALDMLFPAIYLLAYVSARNNRVDRLSSLFVFVPFAVVLFVMVALVGSDGWTDFAIRLRASSNLMGMHLCASIPFLMWKYHMGGRLQALSLLAVVLVLLAILQSRSAIIGSALTLVVAVCDLETRRRRIALRITALGLVMAVVFASAMRMEPIYNIVSRSFERLTEGTTFSFLEAEADLQGSADQRVDIERRLMWLTAYRSFMEQPWRGIGYMNIVDVFEDSYGWPVTSHGLITTLLAETGIIGFLLFLPILYTFFARISRAIQRGNGNNDVRFYRACRDSMIGVLFIGLFHQVQQSQLLFVLLGWGYAIAASIGKGHAMVGRD